MCVEQNHGALLMALGAERSLTGLHRSCCQYVMQQVASSPGQTLGNSLKSSLLDTHTRQASSAPPCRPTPVCGSSSLNAMRGVLCQNERDADAG